MCITGSHIPGQLPQGQVWATSDLCFVLRVPLYLGIIPSAPTALLYFWAFVCPWASYLGSEVAPSLFLPLLLHFICRRAPYPRSSPAPSASLLLFSTLSSPHSLRDISKHRLKFTGETVRLNIFQPILKLNWRLWTWKGWTHSVPMILLCYVESD